MKRPARVPEPTKTNNIFLHQQACFRLSGVAIGDFRKIPKTSLFF